MRLFDLAVKDRHGYHFVRAVRVDASRRRAIDSFAHWVQAEFAAG